jgi:1,4-dihydroxy-2-naphthoyl-CoA hydrolase
MKLLNKEALESKIIWFRKDLHLSQLTSLSPSTMAEYLGMEWVDIGPDFLKMKMPVDSRTHQPYGLLHGGASCALAETVGSIASHLVMDSDKFICVGIEINANHLRSVRQGHVTATASPLHLGATTHVWDIKIHDDAGKLVCVSRLTVAILKKKRV